MKTVNQIGLGEANIEDADQIRHDIIAKLAYAKAMKRNFEPNHELDDWLEAEHDYTLIVW